MVSVLSDGGPALFRNVQPTLLLDGAQTDVRWGRTVVPVPPGRHHLRMHVRYPTMRRFGPASLVVTVPPGQVVELEYRTPMFTFSRGALGPPPQRARGGAASLVAVLVVLAVIFGGACVYAVVRVLIEGISG